VLDPIVLGYDPLVVVLVRASRKGTSKFWFAFCRAPCARNESKQPFPEVFFNKMFVKVKRCDANNSNVVTHQALHFFGQMSILVTRVLKMNVEKKVERSKHINGM
jgi:hypothetical protein